MSEKSAAASFIPADFFIILYDWLRQIHKTIHFRKHLRYTNPENKETIPIKPNQILTVLL
jgi:hypothetical protein